MTPTDVEVATDGSDTEVVDASATQVAEDVRAGLAVTFAEQVAAQGSIVAQSLVGTVAI